MPSGATRDRCSSNVQLRRLKYRFSVAQAATTKVGVNDRGALVGLLAEPRS
jgi:hypothetical protein